MKAYGSINITGGADTLALSTTAGQLVSFSAAGGSNGDSDSYNKHGNTSVVPDYANNRIKVAPGDYLVHLTIAMDSDGAFDLTAQIHKNGTAVSKLKTKQRVTTDKNQITLTGILNVTEDDNPDTLGTFADPSATSFTGAGKAPKNLVPITVYLTAGAGTPTLTFEEAQLVITRLDD